MVNRRQPRLSVSTLYALILIPANNMLKIPRHDGIHSGNAGRSRSLPFPATAAIFDPAVFALPFNSLNSPDLGEAAAIFPYHPAVGQPRDHPLS